MPLSSPAGAPADAAYVLQASDADLPNAFELVAGANISLAAAAGQLTVAAGTGVVEFTGVGTPADLPVGQTDDWAPALAGVSRLEVAVTGVGLAQVSGLAGGADGRVIIVTNVDAAETIALLNQNVGSAAANRFAMNGDVLLPPGASAAFLYVGTASRWTRLNSA